MAHEATSNPGIEALRAGRGGVDALVAAGVQCLLGGDARAAAAFARAAHCVDENVRAPKRLLGHALVALGEHAEAIGVLRASLNHALDAPTARPDAPGEPTSAELALRAAPLHESGSRIVLGRALCAMSRTHEAIPEFERAVRLEPASAHAFASLGEGLMLAKRYGPAVDALNRAIALDPAHGPAYTSLGQTLIDIGQPVAALDPLGRALALDTARGAPAVAFGLALMRVGKLGESLAWFNKAIEIEPTCADAFRHLGRALSALRLDKEALDCIRAARQLRGGDWPDTWMDEAGLLLRRGDFRAGWRAYEKREFAQRLATIVPPVWSGDDTIEGESLLLIAEQGLGDTLQFIRFAPRLIALGAKVTVEVQPPLRDLFKRCFAQTGVEITARGDPQPAATRQNSLVGMPYALQADPATYAAEVPYLYASEARTSLWRERLDAHWSASTNVRVRASESRPGIRLPRLRVGIVASGNPLFRNDAERSMALAEWSPLFARDDIQWVIVQPELRDRDRATLAAHPSVWWIGEGLRDFDDTAGLIAALDLVISVDTGVAHLSGAMGRPVWVLLPYFGDWRWLHDRADSPWYPSARLFRQPQPQDWHSVMNAVDEAIAVFESDSERSTSTGMAVLVPVNTLTHAATNTLTNPTSDPDPGMDMDAATATATATATPGDATCRS